MAYGYTIDIFEGNVTLGQGVVIRHSSTNSGAAIQLSKYNANRVSLTILDGASITSESNGIDIFGENATVSVKGGKIKAKKVGIASEISDNDSKSANLEIDGGSIESETSAGIYYKCNGNLTIKNGNISGCYGVVNEVANLTISNGTISADSSRGQSNSKGDLFEDDDKYAGVAVVVAKNSNDTKTVGNITGGIFNSTSEPSIATRSDNSGTLAVSGGIYNNPFNEEFVINGKTELSITKKDATLYYVGLTAEDLNELVEEGSTVTVIKGDLDIKDLPNNVIVKNTGDGKVTVNGYEVTEEGVNTTELNKLKEANSNQKDETPKTGVNSGLVCVISIAVLSALGIVVLEKKKVK